MVLTFEGPSEQAAVAGAAVYNEAFLAERRVRVNARGEAIEELSANYAGKAWATGANARYLLDALGAMRTEDAVVKCGDELAPVLIEQASSHDVEVMCILIPMRI